MNTDEFLKAVLAKLESIERKLERIEKIKIAQQEPCPAGMHRDPESGECVADVPPSTREECEARGGTWDVETGICTLPKTESVSEGLTGTPTVETTEELTDRWAKEDAEREIREEDEQMSENPTVT